MPPPKSNLGKEEFTWLISPVQSRNLRQLDEIEGGGLENNYLYTNCSSSFLYTHTIQASNIGSDVIHCLMWEVLYAFLLLVNE